MDDRHGGRHRCGAKRLGEGRSPDTEKTEAESSSPAWRQLAISSTNSARCWNSRRDDLEDDGLGFARSVKMARRAEADEQVCEFTGPKSWPGAGAHRSTDPAWPRRRDRAGLLTLALEYGPRLGRLFFHPDSFRPDAPGGAELELGRYTARACGSDEPGMTTCTAVTLMDDTVENHRPAGRSGARRRSDTIWLGPDAEGELQPISYDAMRYRLLARRRAGIDQETDDPRHASPRRFIDRPHRRPGPVSAVAGPGNRSREPPLRFTLTRTI